jgi:hypothetical protein
VYVVSLTAGSSPLNSVTVGGSAASIVVANTGNSLAVAAMRVTSSTTTADIVLSGPSTYARAGIHVYAARPNKREAYHSTAQSPSSVSTAETLTIDIPAGGFAFAAYAKDLAITTAPFVTGTSEVAASTFSGTEPQTFVSAVTEHTTALRTGHSIATTHSSGGAFTDALAVSFF